MAPTLLGGHVSHASAQLPPPPERRRPGAGARIFTKTIDHLDAVMDNNGIDSADLIDQLERVQNLITATLEELGDA